MLQLSLHHQNLIKTGLTLCVTGACLLVLGQRLATIDIAEVLAALQAIPPVAWTLALCATCVSFLAVAEYDVLWHRQLKTGVSGRRARSSGMAAIAVGQAVGLGALTGTFVRWHLLEGTPIGTAARVSFAVCMSFLLCWCSVASAAAVHLGLLSPAQAIAGVAVAGLAICIVRQRTKGTGHIRKLGAFIALTCIDVVFAGIALWILMPAADPSLFMTVIAAYVLALGVGLVSNAPGGVGAFELVLLGLITMIPETSVLAGVLAFRVVYYFVPAMLAGGLMLRSHFKRSQSTPRHHLYQASPVSDLCHQGAQLMTQPDGAWVIRRHLLGRVAIEPHGLNLTWPSHIFGFRAFYKAGRRQAALARRAGWQVRLIAQNAIITPTTWTDAGSARSGLRRKLKQAQKAGVRVARAEGTLPLAQMDAIAADWAAKNCGELGYAMGRYTHSYVAQQEVYLIWQGSTLCGFITVQTRADAWGLDLIRHVSALPNGAMQAAIKAIIDDARATGITRFNLGAVPDGPPDAGFQCYCARRKAGLRQFKTSFGPDWEPLYHVAPSVWQWSLSMLLICLHIQRPLQRLPSHLCATIAELIKKARIIHLPHNVSSGIDRPSPVHERSLP